MNRQVSRNISDILLLVRNRGLFFLRDARQMKDRGGGRESNNVLFVRHLLRRTLQKSRIAALGKDSSRAGHAKDASAILAGSGPYV